VDQQVVTEEQIARLRRRWVDAAAECGRVGLVDVAPDDPDTPRRLSGPQVAAMQGEKMAWEALSKALRTQREVKRAS
jgi:hypothetical protein